MFVRIRGFLAQNAVPFTGPLPQINQTTALGTKRLARQGPMGRLLAGGAEVRVLRHHFFS